MPIKIRTKIPINPKKTDPPVLTCAIASSAPLTICVMRSSRAEGICASCLRCFARRGRACLLFDLDILGNRRCHENKQTLVYFRLRIGTQKRSGDPPITIVATSGPRPIQTRKAQCRSSASAGVDPKFRPMVIARIRTQRNHCARRVPSSQGGSVPNILPPELLYPPTRCTNPSLEGIDYFRSAFGRRLGHGKEISTVLSDRAEGHLATPTPIRCKRGLIY